jgi:hypothetical protein
MKISTLAEETVFQDSEIVSDFPVIFAEFGGK